MRKPYQSMHIKPGIFYTMLLLCTVQYILFKVHVHATQQQK
jgi:hypothetical protein